MNTNKPRNEDAGYGNSSLVGDDRAGLRSALESREASTDAREQAAGEDDTDTAPSDAGRLADATRANAIHGAAADSASGPSSIGESFGGERAAAGRGDVDRSSRDHGNSLQDD